MSLKAKITVAMGVIAATVGLLAGAGAYLAASNELAGTADDFLRTRAAAVTDSIDRLENRDAPFRPDRGPGVGFTRGIDRALLTPDATTQVIDVNGELVFSVDGEATLPITEDDLAIARGDASARLTTLSIDDESYRIITAPVAGGGAVQVARLTTEDGETLRALRRQLLVYIVVGAAVAAAAGWLFARRTTRPIESLAASTRDIAATGALRDVPTATGDDREVAELASSFNQMVHALATSRDQQHQLVMDASHELRTPLTSLRGGIELLSLGDRLDDADRATLLENLGTETLELQSLVEELVDLATDRSRDETPTEFELAALAEQVAARARTRHQIDVSVHVASRSRVTARRGAVERSLANLVDNAVKHGTAPVEIEVDGRSVSVRDHGPGIDEADLPRVFDRFWRADSARSRPGSGLGLSIVHRNITEQGGSVTAANHPDGGAILGFTLATGESADS